MGFRGFLIKAILCLSVIIAIPLAGARAQPAPPQDKGYVLGPGDIVEVGVLGRATKDRSSVRPDGTILVDLLGPVQAANRTVLQLSDQIAGALRAKGVYTNPVVTVEIVSYSSRYVTVLGSVATPGLVPVDRAYRVSEIMARVGGVREGGADYVVLRPASGEEQRLAIEKLGTGGVNDDPMVAPGDKLFVPKAETFFIYGQVNAPGAYQILDGMTLRKAIARGGGLTPSGSQKRLKLYRAGKRVTDVDIDQEIQPEDVLVIGERFF